MGVLILCTWCFVCLSTALSSAFGKVGAGRGLKILHVNVQVFSYLGVLKAVYRVSRLFLTSSVRA